MSGKLYIIGLGPGDPDHLTPAAREALERADVVAGYRTYLDLVPQFLSGKTVIATGMRQEVERCRLALDHVAAGRVVALVSGGDAGIYGMAGLALEMAGDARGEIEVVPGVSALQAAAAKLGAPLMHDFAVISLSDLLTPWPLIRKRLIAAAAADFVVALYNPRSRQRTWQLEEARRILCEHRDPQTPVGIVRRACRPEEWVHVTTLADLPVAEVDMFSLVIIGNAATYVDTQGRMVTPRGYDLKREAGAAQREFQPSLTPHSSPLTHPKARALFIGGTGSDVGKSVLTAGLCRVLKREGVDVAPFKAQNMALNSAVTPDGAEIGRAQAMQAFACGLPPTADMNPVLLKPNSDTGAQVIVHGRPQGNMTVREYHAYKNTALAKVEESLQRLMRRHEVVVLEGAGSVAEINLKEQDITNLRAATLADAPALLVADIDRGGVFASIVGTLALLEPDERARIKGIIINRFRGDKSLLEPGLAEIEQRCGVPVLGVIPWLELRLPEEDSVGLSRKQPSQNRTGLRVGVVRLPRISNYTDFDPLEQDPAVNLTYLGAASEVASQDVVILPGSKSVVADLTFLRESGFAAALEAFHANGGRIIGVCGGYQMLGGKILDPDAVESACASAEGLGLLDVETTLARDKQTHQVIAVPLPAAEQVGLASIEELTGYEIHMGETVLCPGSRALFRIKRRSGLPVELIDGAISADGRVWGCYLHGLFDDGRVRAELLRGLGQTVDAPADTADEVLDRELNRLADHLADHLDLDRLGQLVGLALPRSRHG